MSESVSKKIENAEKKLNSIFDNAPFLLKQNHMFAGVTSLSCELLEILKMQQKQIEVLNNGGS